MSFMVTSIPPSLVNRYWGSVRPYIDSALEHSRGEIDSPTLFEWLIRGEAQLWAVLKREDERLRGVAVTQIIEYPLLKAVRIISLGGEGMSQWAGPLDRVLGEYAKTVGASRVEAHGRRGFVRRLSKLSYVPIYTVVAREVQSG